MLNLYPKQNDIIQNKDLFMFRRGLPIALIALMVTGTIAALRAETNGIRVSEAWARETPSANSTGVVYLSVTDTAGPDRLVSVATPVSTTASLHESHMVNGVMQMRPVSDLPVAPSKPLRLQPNGYHIMLMGLKKKLSAGDSFPLTLSFTHAGDVTTTVSVRSLRDRSPMHMENDMNMGTTKH
ncbi:MAG TPA: copper chaperone PCu(A)C [Rhodopila sp.]|nr:copper chaperone PCu(A)C [Rhodopila sp.]